MSVAQQEFWAEATALAQTINSRRARGDEDASGATTATTADDDYRLGTKVMRGARLVYGYRELFFGLAVVLLLLALVGVYLIGRELVKG